MSEAQVTPLLIVPGLGGSGSNHWQTIMVREAGSAAGRAFRVDQQDWDAPTPTAWNAGLDAGIQRVWHETATPMVLVAHSLGCVVSVQWCLANAEQAQKMVAGLLLVAPADVDSPVHTPDSVRAFAPLPLQRLPVMAQVVASQTDPYCAFDRSHAFADAWGASLCNVGDAGHINPDAGFGPWPLGRVLAQRLAITARERRARDAESTLHHESTV